MAVLFVRQRPVAARWRAGRDRNKAITAGLASETAPGGLRRNTAVSS
jgi:hypothetical protein